MLRKLLVTIIAGIMLLFSAAAFALTLDEARGNVDKQATEKKLGAKDHSQAVATLQRLVDKGVPVEHAFAVVNASINAGIKGRELAAIAKSIEKTDQKSRADGASVAAEALKNRYTARETERIMETYRKTIMNGAPSADAAQVMTRAITKNLNAGEVAKVTERYSAEVKSGTPSDKAVQNAAATMDSAQLRTRDRKMDHTGDKDRDRDRDRDMIHDQAGSGPGMEHGMGMGPGAGSGMGPGMGGTRR